MWQKFQVAFSPSLRDKGERLHQDVILAEARIGRIGIHALNRCYLYAQFGILTYVRMTIFISFLSTSFAHSQLFIEIPFSLATTFTPMRMAKVDGGLGARFGAFLQSFGQISLVSDAQVRMLFAGCEGNSDLNVCNFFLDLHPRFLTGFDLKTDLFRFMPYLALGIPLRLGMMSFHVLQEDFVRLMPVAGADLGIGFKLGIDKVYFGLETSAGYTNKGYLLLSSFFLGFIL